MKEENFCPECKKAQLIYDEKTAEIICESCGLVVKERVIDHGPEWRAYNREEEQRRARAGMPTSLSIFDKDLGSEVGKKKSFMYNSQKIKHLRKVNTWMKSRKGTDRNLKKAFGYLDSICSQFHLPRLMKEGAALLYRKILKKNLANGRSIKIFMATSIYIICRKFEFPINVSDLIEFYNITNKSFRHYYSLVIKEFQIKLPPISISKLITKYVNRLEFSYEVEHEALRIYKECRGKDFLIGKAPDSIAASIIYVASIITNDRRTQGIIGGECKTTEVTLRNLSKLILKNISINKITSFI